MKLKLNNFRCYTKREFVFSDKGLSLLSAISGKGKSTIFNAITYCLYGELKKPYSFSATTCSVQLEIFLKGKKYTMIRQAKPRKFTLTVYNQKTKISVEYEGADAQGIIDSDFLTFHEFMASSYIRQKENNSILSLTPMEQLEFIKKLALDENIGIFKTKIKDLVKQRLEYLNTVKSNLISSKSQLEEVESQKDKYKDFPKKNPLSSSTIASINDVNEKIKTITDRTISLKEEKNIIQEELNNCREYEKKTKENEKKKIVLETELSSLTSRLNSFDDLSEENEIESIEKDIEDLTSLLTLTKQYIKYSEEYESFKESEIEYFNEIEEKLSEIELISEDEYKQLSRKKELISKNKIEIDRVKTLKIPSIRKIENSITQLLLLKELENDKDIKSSIKNHSKIHDILKNKVKILEKVIENSETIIDKMKDDISKGDVYECPACSIKLQFCDSVLVKSENETDLEDLKEKHKKEVEKRNNNKKVLDKLKICLSVLENNIENASLDIPTFDLALTEEDEEKINRYNTDKTQYEQYKNIIDNKILPNSLNNKKRKLIDDKKKIPADFEYDKTVEELEEIIKDKTTQTSEYYRRITEYNAIKKDIDNLSKKLERFKDKNNEEKPDKNIEEYEDDLKDRSDEIDKITIELRRLEMLCLSYGKYELYKLYMDNIKKWKERVDSNKLEYEKAERKYSSSLMLKEKSSQAEILALESIISTINEQAKFYLDMMFEDDPILVELENLKETKNDIQTKLNTHITYKGSCYDDINQLSGGERDRVSLAFILAVNAMLNSPILLLDECLESLDIDTNSDIFEVLKDVSGDKLIMVISHNTIQGLFDNVYTLE